MPITEAPENRVLILAPTQKDAQTTCDILRSFTVDCVICRNLNELCIEIRAGAGVALLTEEAITSSEIESLRATLNHQPPWSDLPLLILMRGGMDSPVADNAMQAFGNVTLLERPIRVPALVSAVRAALRSRQRQYQIRQHLFEREASAEKLVEANHRKDEFLAMLAHELRNPLAAVSNAVQVARRTKSQEHIDWSVSIIESQVKHLSRMIDDLLDVSRITRGKIQLRKQHIDLLSSAQRAVETVKPLIEQRKHQLHLELPDEPIFVEADPTRLEQIIGNLLTNAAKYTESGGQITLSLRKDGTTARLAVRDNGIGISGEMLPLIFDLFTQVSRSIDRSEGGLGIGLTLVKRLVEMHGGEVSAMSDGLGSGSEFSVALPIAKMDVRESVPSAPRAKEDRSLRVLVVDDNVDTADGMVALLKLLGHDVRCAYDGPEALRLAPDFRPQFILLDIGLPGMDGYEVARELRKFEFGRAAKIIAVSGYGQAEDRKRSKSAGFDHHLVKPIEHDALLELF